MQCVIIGIIAARPGCIRIRVSREMSFGPNTKPASRVSESFDAAASLSASSTPRAVSSMAQTRIDMAALMSLRRLAMALRSATVETLGTRMPSGLALPAMVTSSIHQGVSRLLTRISTSRLPNPPAAIALAIWSRATALASGATESSRSRMMPSAGRLRAFSSARAFDPGMNNRLRRGRIMAGSSGGFEPHALTFQTGVRKPCSRHRSMVSHARYGQDTMAPFPQHLLDGYRAFTSQRLPTEQTRYRELSERGQSPAVMVIGCCDSRVSPEVIFDAGPGELFVVRNVANLVPVYQPDGGAHGVSAALEYAVNVLRIKHVVVLGHAQCGGIRAFIDKIEPLSPGDFIGRWMQMFIKPGEVVEQRDRESMHDFTVRIEKAAVFRSLENLMTFPF